MLTKKIIILFMFLVGCHRHDSEHETMTTVNINEVSKDIKIPKNLLTALDKEIADDLKSTAPMYIFLPLKVAFTEKNSSVISANPMQFVFQKGGGHVDLKEVVIGQGSFFMSFPAEQFVNMSDLIHLYFISESPIKKIDGEEFGLGCGKWVDIKSRFKKLQEPEFFKLNTTGLRYLHVLAGHYLFVFKQASQIYLSQLTITDSRYPDVICSTKVGLEE